MLPLTLDDIWQATGKSLGTPGQITCYVNLLSVNRYTTSTESHLLILMPIIVNLPNLHHLSLHPGKDVSKICKMCSLSEVRLSHMTLLHSSAGISSVSLHSQFSVLSSPD